jgi:hypothetical protein
MFEVFGGTVSHAGEVVHGKSSDMFHDGKGVFEGASVLAGPPARGGSCDARTCGSCARPRDRLGVW